MTTMSQAISGTTNLTTQKSKGLHIALWAAQGLLGLAFLGFGVMKATMPVEQLAAQMPWVGGGMGSLVRFIGAAEIAGGLGLILPAASRIKPSLTPLAALGLTTIMALAAATHASRGEYSVIPMNVVLGGIAAFIAWGRQKKAPIPPRS